MSFKEVTIGPCRLICADCMEVLPTLSGVDAVCTDPPYSSGGMVRSDRMQSTRTKYQSSDVQDVKPLFTGDNRDQRGFLAWCSVWLMHCETAMVSGGAVVIFSDWRQLPTSTDALQSGGFVWRGIVVWDKCNARPMPDRFDSRCEYAIWGTKGPREFLTSSDSRYLQGLVKCPAPMGDDRVHSTQKPVAVMVHLVEIAPKQGLVLDPFMGSGTTLLACIASERRGIGIEKDPQIFDIAVKRIQQAWDLKCSELPFEPPSAFVQKTFLEVE